MSIDFPLTLSGQRPLSYKNKSMDWFLYDNGPRNERVMFRMEFAFSSQGV